MDTFSKRDLFEYSNRLYNTYMQGNLRCPRLVGIVLARPEEETVKKELLPSLLYFNARSADFVDFLFAGYQRIGELDHVSPDGETGRWTQSLSTFKRVNERDDWYFSPEEFDDLRRILQDNSRWRYSGGFELLLLNLQSYSEENREYFDFSKTISLRLNSIKDSKIALALGELFEKIFQYSEHPNTEDPVDGLSDYLGIRTAGSSLKKVFLSLLPKDTGTELAKIATFAVHDLRS